MKYKKSKKLDEAVLDYFSNQMQNLALLSCAERITDTSMDLEFELEEFEENHPQMVQYWKEEMGGDPRQLLAAKKIMQLYEDNQSDLEDPVPLPADMFLQIASRVQILPSEKIENNPFFQLLRSMKRLPASRGRYIMPYIMEPASIFFAQDPYYFEDSSLVPVMGMYDKEITSYVVIDPETDEGLTDLNPHYLHYVDSFVEKAKGDVVILNDHLGYAAFQCAQKEEVDTVTIVVKDGPSADFLIFSMLKHFPNDDKIYVLPTDPVTFCENLHDGDCDSILALRCGYDAHKWWKLLQIFKDFKETDLSIYGEKIQAGRIATYILTKLLAADSSGMLFSLDFSIADSQQKLLLELADLILEDANIRNVKDLTKLVNPDHILETLRKKAPAFVKTF